MDTRETVLHIWTVLVLTAELNWIDTAEVYTNAWAVQINGGPEEADRIAKEHGFTNHGNVFGDYYHFRHHAVEKRAFSRHKGLHIRLESDSQVLWVEQQVVKKRKRRDVLEEPTDPEFPKQWYLSTLTHQDLNTKVAWAQGYTGKGIVVTILDDGIEKDHPDLISNYDPKASYDVNDGDADPQPRYTQRNENRHGTRCAGEVAAAANNGVCGVGVAYNAKVGGVRMLDGEVTDVVEAHSLGLNPQYIHIYSASWGPEDDGKSLDGPAKLAKEAFQQGITKGRGGLGSIFVWASGNGGREQDNCNCDGYTNSIYTLSISSTTQSGNVPWYSEPCSSTLATTFSSGNPGEKQIVTTDLRQKCTDSHTGTSASAPLAAGIIALALEANMNLTWRDMQHLVVRTARPKNLSAGDWKTNGVGRRVSHSYGYGILDAGAMVALAQNWTKVGPQRQCVHTMLAEPRDIGSRLVFSKNVDACWGRPDYISSLEHVQAHLTLVHNQRGKLAIHLVSPLGTRSTLLFPRPNDFSTEGFNEWAFMTTHSWDEDPQGEWTLEIENVGANSRDYGVLSQFKLTLWGTGSSVVSPLSSDFPRPSNNSCKTFDAQQICIECSPGFSLFLQGCVKLCPPGFTSGPQLLNLSLENWVDLSSVQACLPCHPSCLTCFATGYMDCLSCPPHSHLVLTSCLHQNQVQRKSPAAADDNKRGGGGDHPDPGSPSQLPAVLAILGCAFILTAFAGVFLTLQLRSGVASSGRRTKLLSAYADRRVGFSFGLGRGQTRRARICYKGIPAVWRGEDVTAYESESDSEEVDDRGERTAFIKTQSVI
ncbi:furin (paired basic amino acid cleaving enzyme) b [Syngnathoides biaculeatus]|uniref:furin (paired basic amino acid cleaving enzyme) b n=1 Tax=Syngnathoides biaculeatus TaxID=300417 RepID=UPI002ADD4E8D|nr:furin (paired basic amino acid cleaving enzyme) b [Syngnathoides biaculeatus]XP_061678706.1 furin (paired basic amino acid cleaving enzyme) b [Syngnathoides biaculeatus]XP_061678707.1 furin (paired basic amino acid cleaving enzyme) b [Syngnathoides biaculeatus]XP_061678708.1 furin (paired basic amino acid cleaving enzyme) b [Syngnathoides biaculeatus]XP_061678709.1 furin (paired basic amino acid cleaving enzyme) b [Syngnathoides biaculeatus]XP_061678710.1 furin (paired basic amino acid clea